MTDRISTGVTPTEQLLAKLCFQSFLRLWSYANPYKDDGHEFCDVLAVFENHIFIFFDRHKNFPDITEDENPQIIWERWKRRAIDDQIKTAHGAERYLRSKRKIFLDAKKQNLFPIDFDVSEAIIHKIVVAHGAADACRKFSDDNITGSLAIGYSNIHVGMPFPFMIELDKFKPVHILDTSTLPIILGELDTVRDFANYMDEKIRAIGKYDSIYYCGEEDLLANYWTNMGEDNNHFIGSHENAINSIMIAEGSWERLKKRPEYRATKVANSKSYFWDELINKTCENYINGSLLGNNDLLKGKSAIHEMAKEPRFIRRNIVNIIFKAISSFPESPSGLMRNMTFIPSFEKGKGYVFLQLWVPDNLQGNDDAALRAKRQEVLLIACGAAKNEMPELHTVIGIGIEPPKLADQIAEDFILLDCTEWPDDRAEEFREKNEGFNFFGTPSLRRYEGRTTEFVSSPRDAVKTSRVSKIGRNETCPCGSGKKYKKCHGRKV